LLAGGFTAETARSLSAQGEAIAIFVMLQLAALVVKANAVNGVQSNDGHPSEPSGSVAVFLKPLRKRRRKKPGAKPGPKGSRRPPPESVTQHVMPVAMCCPDCGGNALRECLITKKLPN
jgi:hypothetical protein